MFLHRILDRDAREAFVGLASHVLKASGDITAREARLLLVMHAELQLSVGSLEPASDVESLAARVTHPQARGAALLELFRLAYADEKYLPAERAVIERIAKCWGAPAETLAWLDAWVRQHGELYRTAERWILQSTS